MPRTAKTTTPTTKKKAAAPRAPRTTDGKRAAPAVPYQLRLYVAGQTPRSLVALTNLKRICEEHLAGQYSIEVIDLLEKPQLAKGDQILAIPTLVRSIPTPLRRIIGDLSNAERVLVGLDLRQPGGR